jgi:uncharacterized membrane protein YbaN (DUF454 family)
MLPSRRSADEDSSVRIRAEQGSVRVEAAALFLERGEAHLENLIKRLFQLPAVRTIDVDRGRQSVVIDYDPGLLPVEAALRSFSDALQGRPCDSPLERLLRRSPGSVRRVDRRRNGRGDEFVVRRESGDPRLPAALRETGAHHETVRRLVHLALGGACFVMSVVGIMTPFVPTMPFVLATGYFLSNSSATLHGLFLRSPLFGEMLTDWEERGGWRVATKTKLFGLMAFLWGLTLSIAGFSWPLVVVGGLMSGISVVTILRVPTVSAAGTPAKLLPAPA